MLPHINPASNAPPSVSASASASVSVSSDAPRKRQRQIQNSASAAAQLPLSVPVPDASPNSVADAEAADARVKSQKHNEAEVRRRQRLNSLLTELSHAVSCERPQKSAILRAAIERVKELTEKNRQLTEIIKKLSEQQKNPANSNQDGQTAVASATVVDSSKSSDSSNSSAQSKLSPIEINATPTSNSHHATHSFSPVSSSVFSLDSYKSEPNYHFNEALPNFSQSKKKRTKTGKQEIIKEESNNNNNTSNINNNNNNNNIGNNSISNNNSKSSSLNSLVPLLNPVPVPVSASLVVPSFASSSNSVSVSDISLDLNYRLMLERANVAMDIVDLNGRIRACNQLFADFVGYDRETLIDPQATFFTLTHPDSMDTTFTFLTNILTGGNHIQRAIKKYITRSGAVRTAYITSWLINDEIGKPQFIGAILEPIQELFIVKDT